MNSPLPPLNSAAFADMEAVLKVLGEKLYADAEKVFSQYHKTRKTIMLHKPDNEKGYLSVGLRRQDNGLTIQLFWVRQKPMRKGLIKEGNRVYSDYIKKGKDSDTYLRRTVLNSKCKNYEVKLFDEFEPLFANLRKRSRLLGEMKRLYNRLNALDA